MGQPTHAANNFFKLQCTRCGNKLAQGKTLEQMMSSFLKSVYLHNAEHSEAERLCEDLKDNISINDIALSFEDEFEIMLPQRYELQATEWQSCKSMMADMEGQL